MQFVLNFISYLSYAQAFINMTGGRRNRTALHYASAANNVAIVKVLLKFNADQEVVDATGYTALNLSNGGEVCRLLHKVSGISSNTCIFYASNLIYMLYFYS